MNLDRIFFAIAIDHSGKYLTVAHVKMLFQIFDIVLIFIGAPYDLLNLGDEFTALSGGSIQKARTLGLLLDLNVEGAPSSLHSGLRTATIIAI